MAFSFTVNQGPATGAVAMYNLIAKLLAQGWLNKADSDGSTYSATGGQVTGGGSGAHGLGNNGAWIRLQRPDGGAEFVIQRSTASVNTTWRIKYVEGGTFTGGSPGATQVPSATNEGIAFGGGTDASPTFATLFNSDGTYRQQLGADGATPYGFWMACYPSVGSACNAAFVYEPLTNGPPGDPSPYAIYVVGVGTGDPFASTSLTSTSVGAGFKAYVGTISSAHFLQCPAMAISIPSGSTLYPFGAGVDAITTNDPGRAIPIGRTLVMDASNATDKGNTTLLRWCGVQRATSGDLGTLLSTKDRIVFTAAHLPWDGATTPS